MEALKSVIRDIPDFPKEGIVFKDITPLLSDPGSFQKVIDTLKDRYKDKKIDRVVGIEARGFIFASALAYALDAGVVMVRKPGKLPYKTYRKTYSLEYGEDSIEIHQDAFGNGQRIVLIDDVLATGGTMAACADLVQNNFQAELVEIVFLVELDFLNGRQKLGGLPIHSMMHF
ncbi:adenine phosphoribosyltransferase [Candidatus Nitromaritima sp. SCGC AAA799-A02]|nr:adenine phosphoribosyltransferase [Candidatus Nitromaritima sp. SCGC AAA799-C22]KMP11374.1 adenine phosphoribosyltransferase [Candidatus Nitromaritima sp. SCGC AAA799-A02]